MNVLFTISVIIFGELQVSLRPIGVVGLSNSRKKQKPKLARIVPAAWYEYSYMRRSCRTPTGRPDMLVRIIIHRFPPRLPGRNVIRVCES